MAMAPCGRTPTRWEQRKSIRQETTNRADGMEKNKRNQVFVSLRSYLRIKVKVRCQYLIKSKVLNQDVAGEDLRTTK